MRNIENRTLADNDSIQWVFLIWVFYCFQEYDAISIRFPSKFEIYPNITVGCSTVYVKLWVGKYKDLVRISCDPCNQSHEFNISYSQKFIEAKMYVNYHSGCNRERA